MKVVLASKNKHKLVEISKITEKFGFDLVLQSELGVDIDVEETGSTFEENSLIKAKAVAVLGYICFADDHRGHGRTESDKNRGRHHGNVFQKIVKDQLFFRSWLIEKYSLPVFFYGHSYGSYIGQALAQCDTDCRAMALSGSNYCNPIFTINAVLTAPIALVAGNWRPTFTLKLFDNIFCTTFDNILIMRNIAIFASGSGTNAENIIRHFENSNLAKI